MWNGRWTTQWRQLQDCHYKSIHETELTGHECALRLLLSVWQSWDDLWSERNAIVHGKCPEDKANIFQDKVLNTLRRIYNQQHLYLPRDRQYLLSTYEIHSKQNIHTIANWIHAYDPVFKRSIKEAQRQTIHNIQSITSYLPRQSSTQQQRSKQPYSTNLRHRSRKVFQDIQRRVTPRIQNYFTTLQRPQSKTKQKEPAPSQTSVQSTKSSTSQIRSTLTDFHNHIHNYFHKQKETTFYKKKSYPLAFFRKVYLLS